MANRQTPGMITQRWSVRRTSTEGLVQGVLVTLDDGSGRKAELIVSSADALREGLLAGQKVSMSIEVVEDDDE